MPGAGTAVVNDRDTITINGNKLRAEFIGEITNARIYSELQRRQDL